MKRPKLRKASKRMTCSKRYRIEKNVRAHNKKVKKNAKKQAAAGKVKHKQKDPGVPNSAPFKESVLREAELRKQRAEAERQRQKEQRQNQVNKRRSLESLQKDALQRQKEFEAKKKIESNIQSSLLSSETSRKSFYKEFRKVVEASDVVIEVLDARDPLGCRCLDMEKAVLESGTDKRVVLLLNKIDLVPKSNVEQWLKYLRNEFPTVAFKASTQSQKSNLTQCKVPLQQLNSQLLSTTSQCLGADNLLKLLGNYCRHNDLETSITVGVVGFPNVGKSSVINSLKRTKACNVGAMPGITKSMQEVILTKNVKILDCPGIVMATGSSDAAVILRNCVKIETLDDPVTPVEAILKRCNKQQMMLRYNITSYRDVSQFLELLAKRKGKLLKGARPDTDAAAKSVLQDWNSGRLSYYTHPPESRSSQLDAKIVSTMSTEFDWDVLEKDNMEALDAVCGAPSMSHSVLFKSAGPAPMDAEVDEEPEEAQEEEERDEEYSDMEEDGVESNMELGSIEITASKKGKKQKKAAVVKNPTPKAKPAQRETLDDVITSGSNIQANRSVKNLMKQKKRRQKRADKLSDKLGESLESAMNFEVKDDSYDFDADMKLPQ